MKGDVKVVLITGGSSGIGAAAARLMCDAGMTVYAASRSGKVPEGYSEGKDMHPVVMDVNDATAVATVVDRIISEQGRLDAVVCNAGNGIAGPVEETSIEEVETQFRTTFYGVVKTIDACLPIFRKQGHGRVVTVSSVAAVAPLPYQGFYSAVKAGILNLTKALAIETKDFGIQCCSVMPGDVKTGFTAARKVAVKAQDADSPYFLKTLKGLEAMTKDEVNGMKPEVIGRAIVRQLRRRRMKPEVTPTFIYSLLVWAIRRFPQSFVLRIIGKMYS
ncbi:MAG: SDR family NAD(P)-dependent oxidoreductase [Bacteroidales bacterium]|nr:SDR family NAD(P)-dependent oxidoreductase [Bacteroidales bacterium]